MSDQCCFCGHHVCQYCGGNGENERLRGEVKRQIESLAEALAINSWLCEEVRRKNEWILELENMLAEDLELARSVLGEKVRGV